MAEIAFSLVTRLIQVISVLAEKEASLLQSVPENTRYIKDELETIGAFLGGGDLTERIQEDKPIYKMAKHWADQVKDLAYDMEDCLEEHIIILTQNSSWSHRILNYRALHHFAAKLSDLRSRIVEVSERHRRYHLAPPYESTSSNMTVTVVFDHALFEGSNQNEEFGDTKDKVGSWAESARESASTEETSNKVAAIFGMCGSATTLAREIYDEKRSQFSCQGWIDLPQVMDVTKVFKDMIRELGLVLSTQAGYIGEEERLAYHIQDNLKNKRFLIVFAGLWTLRDWIDIKRALPHISESGSRIIVTTEVYSIARKCAGSLDHVYCALLLSERKSLKVFKDSVLKSEHGKFTDEDRDDFKELDLDGLKESKKDKEPPFDKIAEVLEKCAGLQLAIETFAQLFASKPPHQWGNVFGDLPSLLYNDPQLKKMKEVMIWSYKGLPPYLKPCFLYLSIFPEDSDINAATVVNRWLAEGFVRETTGMSTKAVAEGYLDDLFDRRLIKAPKLRRNRTWKTFRIHPMMRDILVMIAQEEKFSITIGEDRSSMVPAKRFRHLALYGKSDRKLVKSVDLSGIRSLTVFKEPLESIASLMCSSYMKTVRVLDFSRFEITQRDIRHIGELCHLRYLNLYKTSICELPTSIVMMPFLQYINLRRTKITSLPSEITRLERLQILRASSCSHNSEGVMIPQGMENLMDIEWLDVVDVKSSTYPAIKALRKLTRLKQLGLTGITRRNSDRISTTLQKFSPSLIYLYLGECRRNGTLSWLPHSKEKLQFPCLQSIKLDGHIGKMPEWISRSLTLCVVKLYRSNLQQDDINVLDRIQSLTTLALLDASYISEKLFFYEGTFARLKRLDLEGLTNLHVLKFMKKALCQIREINIEACQLSLYGRNNLNLKGAIRHDSGVTVVD